MTTILGSLDGNGDRPECLVVIFLRGGADGLALVPPTGDDAYYRARPILGVRADRALDLDGTFGLNPALAGLKPIYDDGALAIVHAAGSEDSSRSHFEAQDLMEHGGLAAGGWLGRFLRYRTEPASGALSTVALGKTLPESKALFIDIANRLVDGGAGGIILGCTEIGMLVNATDLPVPVFDTTRIHCESAVARALS